MWSTHLKRWNVPGPAKQGNSMVNNSSDNKSNKGGRASKGTIIKLKDGRFQPFVTLTDGTRRRFRPFPMGTSEARARDMTEALSDRVRREVLVSGRTVAKAVQSESAKSSCAAWVEAWPRLLQSGSRVAAG